MSYPMRSWQGGSRRDPFTALEAMHERMNRFFGDMFTGYQGRTPSWHPDIDIEETGDGWSVEVRLPGVAPDELSVDITERELCIRSVAPDDDGVTESSAPTTQGSRRYSEFSYRLSIPADVDAEKIDATMDHGLLSVRLPRSTEPRARRISVGRRAEGASSGPVGITSGQSAGTGDAVSSGRATVDEAIGGADSAERGNRTD